MTPEKQRLAIAEACPQAVRCHSYVDARDVWEWSSDGKIWTECLDDDPLSDLNAMHEAEQYAFEHLLNADQWEEFGRNLERQHPTVCVGPGQVDYHDLASIVCDLTAAQHAEALLRALGKWEESTLDSPAEAV